MDPLRPSSPDDLRWELTYDRSSIERFIAEVDEEVAQLRAEIEVARERVAVARSGTGSRDPEARAALSDLVSAARNELAALEQEHERRVASIREAAQREAARVIAAAKAETVAARLAAAEFAAAVRHDGVLDAEPASTVEAATSQEPRDAG